MPTVKCPQAIMSGTQYICSLVPRASLFYLLISVHNNTQEQKTSAHFSPIFHSHLLIIVSVNGRYEWGRPGNKATQYVWYMLTTPYSTCAIYTCAYDTLASILLSFCCSSTFPMQYLPNSDKGGHMVVPTTYNLQAWVLCTTVYIYIPWASCYRVLHIRRWW